MAVLGLVAVLVALAWQLLAESRMSARLAEAVSARARLEAIGAAETYAALRRLADDEDLLCDHLDEPWAKPVDFVRPDGVRVRGVIMDEGRRFDVNNLASDRAADGGQADQILTALLPVAGEFAPGARVAALRDWVDADRDGAWEDRYYKDQGRTWTCPNVPLASDVEWAWIAGWGADWAARAPATADPIPPGEPPPVVLGDLITWIPGEHRVPEPVNLNTAPEELLRAMFGNDQRGLVRSLLTLRAAAPLRSYENVAILVDPLRFDRLRPYLAVRSRHFLVETAVETDRQRVRVEALVRRDSAGRVQILRWRTRSGGAPLPPPPAAK